MIVLGNSVGDKNARFQFSGALMCIDKLLVTALACGALASCQRPPDPLAAPPVFHARVIPPPPSVEVTPKVSRPTLADFLAYAGSASVFFEGQSVELDAEAQSILDKQAEWLLLNPQVTASLQGHADLFGGRERQMAIAEMRASAMRRYLVARGVQPNRVSVTSFGKQYPRSAILDVQSQRGNSRGDTVLSGLAGAEEF